MAMGLPGCPIAPIWLDVYRQGSRNHTSNMPMRCPVTGILWIVDFDRWMRVLDPDDPATTGCLESLLGDEAWRVRFLGATAGAWCWEVITDPMDPPASGQVFAPDEKGRACIAAAEMLERWPVPT